MESIGQQSHELMARHQDFVVLLNKEGVIIFSNQKWREYCNRFELSEMLWKVGENYLVYLEKEEKFEELKSIRAILNNQAAAHAEVPAFHSADAAKNLSINYEACQLENGEFGAVLYIHSLHHLPSGFINTESVLESMSDAFYLLDDKMDFYYLNSKSETLLHVRKEDLLGRKVWSVFPELAETAFYTNYNRAVQEKIALQFKEFYAPLNGWFDVKAFPTETGGLAVYYQKATDPEATVNSYVEDAQLDCLTGLPKWKEIEEKIEETLQNKNVFSLLYINLDNLKQINTLYSHDIGDKVMKMVAEKLEKMLAPHEMVGRLDGDEFIVLHHPLENEEAAEFPRKVKELFAHPILLENARPITINASIGVASYPHDTEIAEELISFAETAMQKAKKQPGTSYSVFHRDMATESCRQLLIKKGLSGDLKELGFHFAVQPQINCSTGELDGIEVLARWQHPDIGPISPLEFIGIAEETGMISHLTHHLLNEVFSCMNNNKIIFKKVPKIAVNVTPSLLTSKLFFDDLFRLMEEYEISPESIEIEITESVELTVSEITLQNLLACREKGISIALDDFGTGFSMLAYLLDFPIDKIKLDRVFVTKIGYDQKSEDVLKSLIQFVKSIGCELVAEGVETENEAKFLENHGCSVHQGYFYERPLPPEKFIASYLVDGMAVSSHIV